MPLAARAESALRSVGADRRVRFLLRRAGYDLVRFSPADSYVAMRLAVLRERAVDVVIDVGANVGWWAQTLRSDGYRRRIVSIEPLPGPFAELRHTAATDPDWECLQMAAGRAEGEAHITVSRDTRFSSILPMLPEEVHGAVESVGTHRERVSPLDSLRGSLVAFAERVHVKIDVQGYELDVLEGSRDLMSQTEAVELELALRPRYEGQPPFHELAAWLYHHNFELVSVNPVRRERGTGYLLEIDGLFVKRRPRRRPAPV